MKQFTFDDLVRLPDLCSYQEAFCKATGVFLNIIPAEEKAQLAHPRDSKSPFCELIGRECQECRDTEARIHRSAARKQTLQQFYCFAGLTTVTLPIIIEGRHVATLSGGGVFRRDPTERDFSMVINLLANGAGSNWRNRVREAYFSVPVVTSDRFQAVLQLLTVFAQFVVDYASRHPRAIPDQEPKAVAQAKQFIHSHVEETITLEEVIHHVHVSRFYFCKLFKKSTGLTLTEYVARTRVEKAKALLMDPSLRITEIVFAAGFGSIPQFNAVFKRVAGMSPSQYRAARQGGVEP